MEEPDKLEEFYEELQETDPDIHEDNLLSKIWTKPTATFTYIFKNCPEKYVYLLLFLGGISNGLSRASERGLGDNASLLVILIISIVAGGIFGMLVYMFYAWLLSAAGHYLKGRAEASDFRTVIAWALVPSIAAIIPMAMEVALLGEGAFLSDYEAETSFQMFGYLGLLLVESVLAIWTLIILVKGIAFIQNFSIWKAILNLILPGLVFLALILVVVLLVNL